MTFTLTKMAACDYCGRLDTYEGMRVVYVYFACQACLDCPDSTPTKGRLLPHGSLVRTPNVWAPEYWSEPEQIAVEATSFEEAIMAGQAGDFLERWHALADPIPSKTEHQEPREWPSALNQLAMF